MVDDPLPAAGVVLVELGVSGAVLFFAEDGETDAHRVEEGIWSGGRERGCGEAVRGDKGDRRWWLEGDCVGRGDEFGRSDIGACGHGLGSKSWNVGKRRREREIDAV